MKSVKLKPLGAAFLTVNIATLGGIGMHRTEFLVDTGATHTTIPKSFLLTHLGFTEEYISNNKIILPEREQPIMANGEKANVFKLPITRINIGGYEIQHDYILSSDTVNLSLLLGLDVLSYFKIIFDFDATENLAINGRMFYELRESRRDNYKTFGEPFAHKIKQENNQ